MIRAKFVVETVAKHASGVEAVTLRPVYGDTPENKSWSKWTPTGSLAMTISNPDAMGKLECGREYYIDFTPVPAPVSCAVG